jgi:hypothetical protein
MIFNKNHNNNNHSNTSKTSTTIIATATSNNDSNSSNLSLVIKRSNQPSPSRKLVQSEIITTTTTTPSPTTTNSKKSISNSGTNKNLSEKNTSLSTFSLHKNKFTNQNKNLTKTSLTGIEIPGDSGSSSISSISSTSPTSSSFSDHLENNIEASCLSKQLSASVKFTENSYSSNNFSLKTKMPLSNTPSNLNILADTVTALQNSSSIKLGLRSKKVIIAESISFFSYSFFPLSLYLSLFIIITNLQHFFRSRFFIQFKRKIILNHVLSLFLSRAIMFG